MGRQEWVSNGLRVPVQRPAKSFVAAPRKLGLGVAALKSSPGRVIMPSDSCDLLTLNTVCYHNDKATMATTLPSPLQVAPSAVTFDCSPNKGRSSVRGCKLNSPDLPEVEIACHACHPSLVALVCPTLISRPPEPPCARCFLTCYINRYHTCIFRTMSTGPILC